MMSLLPAVAQRDTLPNFHFVYIDHEPAMRASDVCELLSQLYDNTKEVGDALIVYLANEETPLVSVSNMDKKTIGQAADSTNVFYLIIDELQSRSYHDVDAKVDLDTIKSLVGENGKWPLFRNGEMQYKSVVFDFYVGSQFWSLGYNKKVIADLFNSLNITKYMEKYSKTELIFNVLKPKEVRLPYTDGKPFGSQNLQGINDKVRIFEY